ncbi:SGNH/GDSL hydrolase family protein [uncultured Kordia sp.]|uniref:SGNH/GDSL hydrolase family protein n=1 Tax=uncultured Kordia sp. TaxID=507699 RepID=UPI0026017B49|nr:SGNH/GDSL hydrolase family protein [uncultured Kordia sp.]
MSQQLKQFKQEQARISQKRLKTTYPRELTIVAEGDSWFDYPFRKDIIDYLIKKGYAIDKYAKAGDTLENMVYGTEVKKRRNSYSNKGAISLQKTLNSIRKHKPKIVLFSAGGNDIVGSEILGYLNHSVSNPASLLNKEIFQARLAEMKTAIEFFIKSVRATHVDCNILMDGYDYAKVNGKGYNFIFRNIKGPWLLPSFVAKQISRKSDHKAIIKYLVDEFNQMLIDLDAQYNNFHHIDLRGKFPNDSQWDNEIHLKNSGYREIANIYHAKIEKIFGEDPIKIFKHSIV